VVHPNILRPDKLLQQSQVESALENLDDTYPGIVDESVLVASSRLVELRSLSSAEFDFKKLVRLCEEVNSAYCLHCYYATAMLTRSLLDHVPPLFGFRTFCEVTNNYAGGGRSFKDPNENIITMSYATLRPMRMALLNTMHIARISCTVGPEDLRSMLTQMRPEQLGMKPGDADEVLRHFELRVLTEGSGTQIFSTTFVQWAAREVLRRARTLTLLARYAPRQTERPMNDLLLASSTEEQDPRGSLIDADMGAYYTWLNLTRLPKPEDSRFIALFEGSNEAIAIAPGLAHGAVSTQPCELRQILDWTSQL
jgi:hypothetical protein